MIRPATAVALLALLAACNSRPADRRAPDPTPTPGSESQPAPAPSPDASASIALPPLPAVPGPTLGLPPLPRKHRRIRPTLLAIGEALFSDAAAWGEGGRRCADCHQPDHGFSSPEALTPTSSGKTNLRHTPSLYNLAYADVALWDGRAEGEDAIERMLAGHIVGQLGADVDEIAVRLAQDRKWGAMFARHDEQTPTGRLLIDALAAYVRTRFSPVSPWDRHEAGDASAVGAAAIRGAAVFNARAGCAVCHPPPLYTDFAFHRSAVAASAGPPDIGRMRVTGDEGDRRAFKTPSLRGALTSAPYFHNGAVSSFETAFETELARSSARAAALSDAERADLLAFLRSLSPTR